MRNMLDVRIGKSYGIKIMCAHGNRIYATNNFALVEFDSGYDLEYEGPIFGRDIKPKTLGSILECKYQTSKDEIAMVNPVLLESVLKVFKAANEHPKIHVMPQQIYMCSPHLRAVVMPERM